MYNYTCVIFNKCYNKVNKTRKEGSLVEVGLKIKLMRVGKGLTQDELSRLSGVNIATIVGIEKGRRKPQGNTLMKLNNVLTDGDDEKLSELLKTNNN